MISKVNRVIGQAVGYAVFALVIGAGSRYPAYQRLEPDQAVLKLAITHPGARVNPCHERSAAELAKLPPNMRARQDCGRERNPVAVELAVDGTVIMHETAAPAGFSRDGASRFYRRLVLPAGEHNLVVRLRDSGRSEGYDQEEALTVALVPAQILTIDYASLEKRFVFQ